MSSPRGLPDATTDPKQAWENGGVAGRERGGGHKHAPPSWGGVLLMTQYSTEVNAVKLFRFLFVFLIDYVALKIIVVCSLSVL